MSQGAGYRSYAGDELVTGEGVAVELPVASVAARAASGLIDLLVAALALVLGSIALTALTAGASAAVRRTCLILLVVAVTVGLPAVVETLTRGRTLGKLALGLRVVRSDGGPVTARHALVRALVGWPEIYLLGGSGALVAALVSPRGTRLGDLAAGTVVVSQRVSLTLVPGPGMPPALASWAVAADLGTLPPGLAVAVRQFLSRAAGLTASSRRQLGGELLAALLPHVSPPPPAGTHPEDVLAAVMAERRRRDAQRLARDQGRLDGLLPPDQL